MLLDQITFDGSGGNDCVDTIITQITDNTGNTAEWWVRSAAGGKPCVYIQPQQNPNKVVGAGTTYNPNTPGYTYDIPGKQIPCSFIYEWKDASITTYTIQNRSADLYNMIAMYGGKDPVTQQQIYGGFKDSFSISLYGVRQKKVTNSTLLSQTTLNNYATVYLLLNGYPQPQGSYNKVLASGYMLAGKWVQIIEPNVALPQAGPMTSSGSVCGMHRTSRKVNKTKSRCGA